MRMIYLAVVAVLVVTALGLAGVTRNDDPAPLTVAAQAAVLTLPGARAASPRIMSVLNDQAPLAFCGQCTSDSDCGTSHKCCGPSNCLECFRVDTCP